jgi:hypothetical protein
MVAMAGEDGEINSRAGFHRVLGETMELVQSMLAQTPDDELMLLIFEELSAMHRWSDHGREPTDQECGSINVGLLAARDLSNATGEKARLVQMLFALNNYFADWPSDEAAAHAPAAPVFQLR